eukprot:gene1622-1716_t
MLFDEMSTTLFVGDLSIHCTEKDIFQLFQVFGAIESIQLKRKAAANNRPTYGFIGFKLRESAEAALKYMNGHVIHGRAIRLGWAIDNPLLRRKEIMGLLPPKEKKLQTAQVHYSFITTRRTPLTEELFRAVFEQFGPVLDVAIKKCQHHQDTGLQTGYGFIHYPLSEQGINAAVAAVRNLHEMVVGSIKYSCNISHGLDTLIKSGTSSPASVTRRRPAAFEDNLRSSSSEEGFTSSSIWNSPVSSLPSSYEENRFLSTNPRLLKFDLPLEEKSVMQSNNLECIQLGGLWNYQSSRF